MTLLHSRSTVWHLKRAQTLLRTYSCYRIINEASHASHRWAEELKSLRMSIQWAVHSLCRTLGCELDDPRSRLEMPPTSFRVIFMGAPSQTVKVQTGPRRSA